MEKLLQWVQDKNIKGYKIGIKDIVVENRVYLKCAYGCKDFGKRLNCPPHTINIEEFQKMLKEYNSGIVLIDKVKISEEEDIMKVWEEVRKKSFHKMIEMERQAFKEGYHFAHLLRAGSCNECTECGNFCIKPHMRRFSPEAVGINLSQTLKNINISIDYSKLNEITLVGILLLD